MSARKIARWITLHGTWFHRIPGMAKFITWSYHPGWAVGNRLHRIWANIHDALMGVVILDPMLKALNDAARRDLFDRLDPTWSGQGNESACEYAEEEDWRWVMNSGMFCTNCGKELIWGQAVKLVDVGTIEEWAEGPVSGDGAWEEVLCEECGDALLVEQKPAPSTLAKAMEMEREIAGHLMVDDPHPQIMAEWKEAMDYTDSLLREPKPNRVVVEVRGGMVTDVRAACPDSVTVIVLDHDEWSEEHWPVEQLSIIRALAR